MSFHILVHSSQVRKDRQNWKGKTPKRTLVFGNMSAFDWHKERDEIDKMNGATLTRSFSASSSSSSFSASSRSSSFSRSSSISSARNPLVVNFNPLAVQPVAAADNVPAHHSVEQPVAADNTAPAHHSVEQPVATARNVPVHHSVVQPAPIIPAATASSDANKKKCLTCMKVVWIGDPSCAPPCVGNILAHPLGTDWKSNSNVQPYCEHCWENEVAILDTLSAEHCGKGGKKKSNVIKKPADKKNKPAGGKKGKKKPAAASKGKKKPAAASKGKKKPAATIKEKMTQEKMSTIVKASHNRSIAAASAEASVLLTHDAKETKQKVETVVKENDKKQLGGVQGCIQTALENAHVLPPPPRTPWEVIIYI